MNWKRGPIIGRGSTAAVHLATNITGDIFAVKSTHLSASHFLQKEQQILSKLNSPYIVKYLGFDVDHVDRVDHVPMYNLFMEYATGGTISDVIKNQGGCLDEGLIRCYTRHILLGLDYLHDNNIVHCDVKSANVLVCKDGVKIGDLGCAKSVNQSCTFSGTPVFMAPEVARGEEQGFESDIWSVGCVVIEMATGSNPWPGLNDPVSALHRIGYSDVVPDFPNLLSEEGKDFLKKCLVRNGKERWTAKELLQHPFVSSVCKCKKIESFDGNSPNSILDQGFWDSFDQVTGEPAGPARFVELSGETPRGRMEQLVNSCLPNWGDEGDWITVRRNGVSDVGIEDGSSESNRFDSESESSLDLDGEERFCGLEGIIVECNVDESNGANFVTISRFFDFNNVNNDGCLKLDLDLKFVVLAHLVMIRVLTIMLCLSIKLCYYVMCLYRVILKYRLIILFFWLTRYVVFYAKHGWIHL